MDMSLGRRTASGILFTPSGLSFTFTEKSSETNAGGGRNSNRRRRERNLEECTSRKSKTQSYKVDAMASERTSRGGARRKLPRKNRETELRATSPASVVPCEDDNVADENRRHIYDPYRDMRMDIDDMSYEELLELGERIGTVSTAISEEDLSKCLKRSKYTSGDYVPCSICQEEFVEGDELGEVACSHVYHSTCIEQWLKSKNWCPLCKGSASPSFCKK